MLFRRAFLLFALLALVAPSARTQAPAETAATRCTGPFANHEEAEAFLHDAKIEKSKGISVGVTAPQKLTLNDGKTTQFAAFKSIDDRKTGHTQLSGSIQVDFKDSWKFEVAAYQLDKLLDLHMVPVTVVRKHRGRSGSLQLWVEGMTEGDRMKKKMSPPSPINWRMQIFKVRVFDNLIYNWDRNLGNMLIAPDWKIFMIDHSRSFKNMDDLKSPDDLTYFSRSLIERLKQLDQETLEEKTEDYLTSLEVRMLLKRRDKIVELYDKMVAEKGEGVGYP